MSDFEATVKILAETQPNMRARTLVALAVALREDRPPVNLDDARALADWAIRQPQIAAHIRDDRKIQAIKEIRAATGAGLLQAKSAHDLIASRPWL